MGSRHKEYSAVEEPVRNCCRLLANVKGPETLGLQSGGDIRMALKPLPAWGPQSRGDIKIGT